jgi:thiol-disulfide isomerase/thioredoxin
MSDLKNKIYSAVTSKQFFIILIVTAIFIGLAVYTYNKFVKSKIDNDYVANKEFLPGPRPGEIPTVDLYFFFTEWCPHCKTARPVWDKFKEELNNKFVKNTRINFIEVNCEKKKNLAEKYDIKGYPTIKMVNGNKVIEYDAKTDLETLHQFVNSSI